MFNSYTGTQADGYRYLDKQLRYKYMDGTFPKL